MATKNLQLPELVESQTTPYATHNLALRIIDALQQLIAFSLTPPGSPIDGGAYIIQAGANVGVWSSFSVSDVSVYISGTWYNVTPFEGMVLYNKEDGEEYRFDGESWGIRSITSTINKSEFNSINLSVISSSTDMNAFGKVCVQDLNGFQVAVGSGFSTLEEAYKVVGLCAETNTTSGENMLVTSAGVVTFESNLFVESSPVLILQNGSLSQGDPPTDSGAIYIPAGFPIAVNKLNLRLGLPILVS